MKKIRSDKFYDVSVLISNELPVWPGDPNVLLKQVGSLSKGDDANLTRIEMGAHTGTHIDAPFHFEPDGKTVDQLPINTLVGACRVIEVPSFLNSIDPSFLKNINFDDTVRVLFKTRNSEWWKSGEKEFQEDFVYISEQGARFLIDQEIKLIGIDYLSVEQFKSSSYSTHHLLLRNEVIIIEGLNLSGVVMGEYELIALPLKLKGADGAPARVVLREKSP